MHDTLPAATDNVPDEFPQAEPGETHPSNSRALERAWVR